MTGTIIIYRNTRSDGMWITTYRNTQSGEALRLFKKHWSRDEFVPVAYAPITDGRHPSPRGTGIFRIGPVSQPEFILTPIPWHPEGP